MSLLGRSATSIERVRHEPVAIDEGGRVLPLRVVDDSWHSRPASPPPEWEAGLWALDSSVSRALAGGWTPEEIVHEICQLVGLPTQTTLRGRSDA